MDNVEGYSSHGVRWLERVVNHSVPSNAEAQNKFILRMRQHGVSRENFSFS